MGTGAVLRYSGRLVRSHPVGSNFGKLAATSISSFIKFGLQILEALRGYPSVGSHCREHALSIGLYRLSFSLRHLYLAYCSDSLADS